MMLKNDKSFSLRRLVVLSWLVPGILGLFACVFIVGSLGWLEYENKKRQSVSELDEKSLTASRRISGEILLGQNGSVLPVLALLQEQLGIAEVSISDGELSCREVTEDTCRFEHSGKKYFQRLIPHLKNQQYILLAVPAPSYWQSFKLPLLWIGVVPIVLVLLLGSILQNILMRRYLVEPIRSIIDVAEKKSPVPTFWPRELREISLKLSDSLDAREQSMFALLARGVVHDVKTFMHSLLTGTDLVEEQSGDPEKRLRRLEGLYRACRMNLPKIKRIIELTLDSSRDITVNRSSEDLQQTLENSLEITGEFAKAKGVILDIQSDFSKYRVVHDPIQLERVFSNLIKNSIEAISLENASKEIVISIEQINADFVNIAIDDSGSGVVSELFDDFRPIKSQKSHGAGLGLYVSNKIVRGHDGRLAFFQSKILSGARFSVVLPGCHQ